MFWMKSMTFLMWVKAHLNNEEPPLTLKKLLKSWSLDISLMRRNKTLHLRSIKGIIWESPKFWLEVCASFLKCQVFRKLINISSTNYVSLFINAHNVKDVEAQVENLRHSRLLSCRMAIVLSSTKIYLNIHKCVYKQLKRMETLIGISVG